MIWGINDLLFALAMAILFVVTHRAVPWLKRWVAEDKTMSSSEAKFCKYGILFIRWAGYAMAVISIGTIILPLLDILLSTLLGTAADLFNQYGGVAIVIAFIVAYWKNHKPKKIDEKEQIPPEVAVALARQRGMELQKFMLRFLLRIIEATRSITLAVPPRDEKDLAISSLDNQSFYMVGEVVIFQGIVQINAEITPEMEDAVRDELQNAVPKHIDEYPALIDPTAANTGYPPVEILTVQKSGSRVIIDAVIASEKSISLIKNSRQARVERQKRQEREGDAGDPLFR